MTSAGLMPGGGDQVVVLSGDASHSKGAGITVEPDGGSDQPTSDPVAFDRLRLRRPVARTSGGHELAPGFPSWSS